MLAWLIAVALLAASASVVVTRLADDARREREQELLRIGDEIAGAIASYTRGSAGSLRRYPPELQDLLEDRRALGLMRHLRRIEADPITRGMAWGIIRAADGGVAGVYSRSDDVPLLRVARRLAHTDLRPAQRYADWQFVPRGEEPMDGVK